MIIEQKNKLKWTNNKEKGELTCSLFLTLSKIYKING